MEHIQHWLAQITVGGWLAIFFVALLALFFWWRKANNASFFDFLVNFPIKLFGPVGKIKALKKNTTNLNNRSKWIEGMPAQERDLCAAYTDKMGKITSEKDFKNAGEYLEVTGQGSVKPMGVWVWLTLFLLTMGEAAGTGALLSEYVSTNVTSNEAVYFTWGIAIILALVLLLLTHKAGKAYFEHKTFREILGQNDHEAKPTGYVDGEDISFSDDQFADRGRAQPVRFYARLEKKKARGSLGWSAAALAVLLVIMGAVFGARWYGIHKEVTENISSTEQSSPDFRDPFAQQQQTLPPDMQKAQADSRKQVAEQIGHDQMGQGIMAAIILAVFYLVVQLVGFAMSMQRSFFQRGEDAYALTGGCASYDEYLAKFFWPYANRAEARLNELRSAYARVNEDYSNNMPNTTFVQYYFNKKAHSRAAEHQAMQQLAAATASPLAATPMVNDSTTHADVQQTSPHVDLTRLAESILDLPDREQRASKLKETLASLPHSARDELKATLTKVKQQREAQQDDLSDFADLI